MRKIIKRWEIFFRDSNICQNFKFSIMSILHSSFTFLSQSQLLLDIYLHWSYTLLATQTNTVPWVACKLARNHNQILMTDIEHSSFLSLQGKSYSRELLVWFYLYFFLFLGMYLKKIASQQNIMDVNSCLQIFRNRNQLYCCTQYNKFWGCHSLLKGPFNCLLVWVDCWTYFDNLFVIVFPFLLMRSILNCLIQFIWPFIFICQLFSSSHYFFFLSTQQCWAQQWWCQCLSSSILFFFFLGWSEPLPLLAWVSFILESRHSKRLSPLSMNYSNWKSLFSVMMSLCLLGLTPTHVARISTQFPSVSVGMMSKVSWLTCFLMYVWQVCAVNGLCCVGHCQWM